MLHRQTRITFVMFVILLLLLQLTVSGLTTDKPPVILVDGILLQTAPAPIQKKGIVFLPAAAFKKLGLAVKTGKNYSVWIGMPASEFSDKITSKTKFEDGTPSPFIHKKNLYLPLRLAIDGQALKLEWDKKTNTAHVKVEKSWKEWRIKTDAELRKDNPKWYEKPIFMKS